MIKVMMMTGRNDVARFVAHNDEEEEEDECFFESLDRVLSSCSCSTSNSDYDSDPSAIHDPNPFPLPSGFDLWKSEPESVSERRIRLLRGLGLSNEPDLAPASRLRRRKGIRSSHFARSSHNGRCVSSLRSDVVVDNSKLRCSLNDNNVVLDFISKDPIDVVLEEQMCTIKNLDNGREFVVNEVREDGVLEKLKEVGTDRQLTLEEFEMCAGTSPIVLELMRRQSVEDVCKDSVDLSTSVSGTKHRRKGSWFKSIKSVASSVTGYKERRSTDERDSPSERGGQRLSSATDDSRDVTFQDPERVKVRQYGKSCKELTALFKSQEIEAHKGSIWSIRFSLDGRYLASAGEDCVIQIWEVVESERKGELLLVDKQDDGGVNLSVLANGSPEPASVSPMRRGRTSFSRKSVSLDNVLVPETVFGLSEMPVCSFVGHSDDVLDLAWSKSQHLLSSSMDKTVRLWDLSSKACLKVFSHSDYVTCIQFNPVDDNYFISGSLDAKVRIWSIPDHQVVDWKDLHEMVTAACYTPDGQGALVGSYKGTCCLYNTSDNRLQQRKEINLKNKKKKSNHKKITGFQFVAGSSSEVLVTSADSRARVVDGVDLVHKFKGFRNTNSQISASLTSNGKLLVSASEDSNVYVWNYDSETRAGRSKRVTVTNSYEHFYCRDVSVAAPWPGKISNNNNSPDQSPSTANNPPTPVNDPVNNTAVTNGIISSATNQYFCDRMSATWPDEKLLLAAKNRARTSPSVSVDLSNGPVNAKPNASAWSMVIVTGGLRGEIRTFQNFGLPTMALLMTIILGLILGWLAFVVGLLIGWAWRPRWVSSPSEEKVQSQCSAPRSFELSSPSSPSPLKGFGSAPCFKTLVCGTWNMALRQQKTISPVSSSEQVHVLDGGKKTEERLPNTVTELDLRNLVQLVERKDGGLPWIQMMDQFIPGMRYQAWLREPKNGPTEYRSRTVFEDATPEVVRDFFWDDEFRPTWDTMLASSTTVEECTSTGTMIVRWIRKFPFFCSDREYVIGRRIWNCGKSYYCVTKGVSVPCIPRNNKQKRVDLFYSSWCIRPVESRSDDGVTSACEVLLFHHEDMGIPKEIAKLGVKRGMWGAVKKMEPGLRAYQEQRLSREGGFKLSRPAFMAQINTKITSEHLVSLSNGATSEAEAPETEAPVTLDRGNGAENLKKLLFIGGAVAVACTLSGGGFVPPAVLLGFGKRFGGRKREPQGTATTTTRSQSQTTSS
ncbi:unnamed protein product [Brassica rapa subsp. narinosa]|uniref:(rape) hypothetical protein n=1 Tax=Brassica napus TaxID=3708 RepID=A0A816VJN7_BRANA|nr:unnamed protein product [Brassica napus]